jgi:hypothetical protein
MMAKTNEPDVAAGELAGLLRSYGLNPKLFNDLIHEAVINQWSSAQFIGELYGSDEFAAAFPGIFAEDGSLRFSPSQYLQIAYGVNGYVDIGKSFGIKLGPAKIGELIEGSVSPDEWAFRAMVLQDAKANEVHRQSYNAVIKEMGGEPVSKGEWFEHFAGKPTSKVENLFEAASLYAAQNLDINAAQAVQAAKAIGAREPMAQVDIDQLIQAATANKDIVGPELQAAGITDADLAVLASGSDPKGIRPMLEQILRNRNALTGASPGAGTRFAAAREGL